MKRTLLYPLSLLAFAAAGQAANITYIDAVAGSSGNTYATGSTLSDTSWLVTSNSSGSDDDDWDTRSTFGNGGSVYQANPTVISIPELTTEITGLADASYDVWVFFWDSSGASNKWNISAGLTSGNLTTYSFDGLGITDSNVVELTSAHTVSGLTLPTSTEGDRTLYAVNIGSQTISGAGGAGSIDVFIDHLDGTNSANRTWFDGVGYSSIPESNTYALVAGLLGLSCAIARRRNI